METRLSHIEERLKRLERKVRLRGLLDHFLSFRSHPLSAVKHIKLDLTIWRIGQRIRLQGDAPRKLLDNLNQSGTVLNLDRFPELTADDLSLRKKMTITGPQFSVEFPQSLLELMNEMKVETDRLFAEEQKRIRDTSIYKQWKRRHARKGS